MAKPTTKRNFCTHFYHDSVNGNYTQSLKNSSEETRQRYIKRFQLITIDIGDYEDFNVMLDDIQNKWLDGEYRHTSVRQYKAALMYGLACIRHYQVTQDATMINQVRFLANRVAPQQLESLYDKCKKLGKTGDRKQLEYESSLKQKTSSTKDKRFNEALLNQVLACHPTKQSHGDYELLHLFLQINSRLGLRPIEYGNCMMVSKQMFQQSKAIHTLVGIEDFEQKNSVNVYNISTDQDDNDSPVLIVKNAKDSHGRACGKYRFLSLSALSDEELLKLDKLLLLFQQKKSQCTDFNKEILRPLQKQLYYILKNNHQCQKIINKLHNKKMRTYRYNKDKTGTDKAPIKKHPTLYSTRHQAVANAKQMGINPIVIAATFGHASILTAEEHYGLGYYGNGSGSVLPMQISVNAVIDRLTTKQEQLLKAGRTWESGQAKPQYSSPSASSSRRQLGSP